MKLTETGPYSNDRQGFCIGGSRTLTLHEVHGLPQHDTERKILNKLLQDL